MQSHLWETMCRDLRSLEPVFLFGDGRVDELDKRSPELILSGTKNKLKTVSLSMRYLGGQLTEYGPPIVYQIERLAQD